MAQESSLGLAKLMSVILLGKVACTGIGGGGPENTNPSPCTSSLSVSICENTFAVVRGGVREAHCSDQRGMRSRLCHLQQLLRNVLIVVNC